MINSFRTVLEGKFFSEVKGKEVEIGQYDYMELIGFREYKVKFLNHKKSWSYYPSVEVIEEFVSEVMKEIGKCQDLK
jgi:hypothetical protein